MARKKPARRQQRVQVPKHCYFCKEVKDPEFTDLSVLRRYLTERGKMIPRGRSGLCAKHQRRLAKEVKHARHLGMLPFIVRV